MIPKSKIRFACRLRVKSQAMKFWDIPRESQYANDTNTENPAWNP